MTWMIDLTVRSSLVLGGGLGVTALLRRRRAALRHAVLAAALCGSALVPVGRLLPALTLEVPTSPASTVRTMLVDTGGPAIPATPTGGARVASPEISPWAIVWCAGCLLTLALLAADVIRLRRTTASAEPIVETRWLQCARDLQEIFEIRRPVALLLTSTGDVLATSGLFRPRVFLPRDAAAWPDDRIRIVLAHELAHIRRADWAIQIGAELVRAICWFNPLTWIACTRLRRESEYACDDVVVGVGIPAGEYAGHLLDIARECRRPSRVISAMAMARPSTLHRRITVMLNTRIDHQTAAPRRVAWTAALACAAAFSVVAVQAKQAGPAPLVGTIYDPTGAVMPGVTLTLRSANDAAQTATSDRSGHFEFPAVAPGHYRLATSVPGFRTLDTELDLKTPSDWDRPITLQVGTLQETITVSAERFGAPPVAAGGTEPVRVGGNILPPKKTLDVRPIYPPEMRAAGREGVVPLEAVIRADGTVGSVRVLSAEVHPDFAIAAVDAVRQWRFTPTLLNGKPVEVVMNVSITFKLAD